MPHIYVKLCQKQILELLRKYSLPHLWIGEYQRRSLCKVCVPQVEVDFATLSEKRLQ